jgi:uncharacterized phage-associated protein
MKSPIFDKEMKPQTRREKLVYRKDEFEIVFHYYLDEENNMEFTTTELDELNTKQVHNQYRERYNIPFANEIKDLRETYDLPANKMAEVLGFGVNVYRQYESGDIPSISNGRYLQRMKDPKEFLETLVESKVYQGAELEDKKTFIHNIVAMRKRDTWSHMQEYVFDHQYPNQFNGYKKPDIQRFIDMVVFFAGNCVELTKTKLNKLLFYSDFYHFKRTAQAISGVNYIAIQYGPVPDHYDILFSEGQRQNKIDVRVTLWGDEDKEKHIFTPKGEYQFNEEAFIPSELEVLKYVLESIGKKSTKEIIELSHKEKAWADNETQQALISYNYAFELCTI